MRWIILVACSVALVSGCTGEPTTYAELSRLGTQGVALDGYSPVSYFTQGRAQPGNASFAVEHNGVTYWLTDADQVVTFQSNPDRFQPAHGGWCSLMLTGSGQMTPANPESFKIVDDRLLLFWSGDFNGMAIDGGRNWESKFKNPAGELEHLAKADDQWQKLLSGQAAQRVVLFARSDAARVSDARRDAAKTKY